MYLDLGISPKRTFFKGESDEHFISSILGYSLPDDALYSRGLNVSS